MSQTVKFSFPAKKQKISPLTLLLYTLTGVMVLAACFVVLTRLCGGETYVLESGSMYPAYDTGTVVVTKKVAFDELAVGDVISFERVGVMEGIVTHRIVRIDTAHQLVFTKGDANVVEDIATLPYGNIVGKVQFGIPYVGYPILWIQNLLEMPIGTSCVGNVQ